MSVNIKKDIRRCEICGKVYDASKSLGFITIEGFRPVDDEAYRRSTHNHKEYHACVDCHDKLFKTINDMVTEVALKVDDDPTMTLKPSDR